MKRINILHAALLMVATLLPTCGAESGIIGDPDTLADPDTPHDAMVDPAWEPPAPDFVPQCLEDGECDDGNPCTQDSCNLAAYMCTHEDVTGLAFMGPDIQVTLDSDYSGLPVGVWTGSEIGIAWVDGREGGCALPPGPMSCGYDIFFKRVTSTGEDLGTETRMTGVSGDCRIGALAWSGEAFAMSMVTPRADGAGMQLYFSLIDSGGHFPASPVILSSDVSEHTRPPVTWTGSEWAVVFSGPGAVPGEFATNIAFVGSDATVRETFVLADDRRIMSVAWTGSEVVATWQSGVAGNGIHLAAFASADGAQRDLGHFGSINSSNPVLEYAGSTVALFFTDSGYPPSPYGDLPYFVRVPVDGGALTQVQVAEENEFIYLSAPIWTGSEIDIALGRFFDLSTEVDIVRLSLDGERIADDFPIGDRALVAWTGSEYIVTTSDARTGDWEVFVNRIGICE